MVELLKTGAYVINGSEIIPDDNDASAKLFYSYILFLRMEEFINGRIVKNGSVRY